MIWERIIFLVGVIDQLNVNVIFERKSVKTLYYMIKKKRSTNVIVIVNRVSSKMHLQRDNR